MNQAQQPRIRIPSWWWLLMVAILIWNVLTFWPNRQQEVSLPYSAFLDQVRAGNVSSVQITGDQISGQLAQAITWPQPTPGPTPSGAPAAAAYAAFRTTFPQAVGDSALL